MENQKCVIGIVIKIMQLTDNDTVLNHRQKLLQNKFMQNKKRTSKREPLTKLKAMSHFMMKEIVKSMNAVYETLAIPPV